MQLLTRLLGGDSSSSSGRGPVIAAPVVTLAPVIGAGVAGSAAAAPPGYGALLAPAAKSRFRIEHLDKSVEGGEEVGQSSSPNELGKCG